MNQTTETVLPPRQSLREALKSFDPQEEGREAYAAIAVRTARMRAPHI